MRAARVGFALFAAAVSGVVGVGCTRGHARVADSDGGTVSVAACPPLPPPLRLDPSAAPLAPASPGARGMVVHLDAEPATLSPLVRPDWMTRTVGGHLVIKPP